MAFNKINKGQPDWHIPLNENFDGITDGTLLESLRLNGNIIVKGEIDAIPKVVFQHGETVEEGYNNSFFSEPYGENHALTARVVNKDSISSSGGARKFSQFTLREDGIFNLTVVNDGIPETKDIWNGFNLPIESGTFIPTLIATDGTVGGYSIQQGQYYRVGNYCYIDVNLRISSLGSLSGQLYIQGLPFPCLYPSALTIAFFHQAKLPSGSYMTAYAISSGITLVSQTTASASNIHASGIENTFSINYLSGWYKIA